MVRSKYSELCHARLQRRGLEPETLRCASVSADAPVGALERRANVLDFEAPQRERYLLWAWDGRLRERHDQPRPRGENDRPLDHVAQLADVARPLIRLHLP